MEAAGLVGGGASMGSGDLSARPWHVPRFVAVACGGNKPPCREVNIVCVCVCVLGGGFGWGGLGLLLVEFVQFLREQKKTSWETVTKVNEQFPLCRREYSYQLNPALQIL